MSKEGLQPPDRSGKFVWQLNSGIQSVGRRLGEFLPSAEAARVVAVRDHVLDSDLSHILDWVSDWNVRVNLEPPPTVPRNRFDRSQREQALIELEDYYNDSDNMTPLVAVNPKGEPVGVVTVRWKEDPYIKNQVQNRTPVIERLIVNPKLQHKGIGTGLMATAVNLAFHLYNGYDGNKASKIYTWIMERGDWRRKYNFFRGLGFQVAGHWKEIAKRAKQTPSDDAMLLELKHKWWHDKQKERKSLEAYYIKPKAA